MTRVLLIVPSDSYRASAFLAAAQRLGVELTVATDRPNTLERFNPSGLLTLRLDSYPHLAQQVREFCGRYPVDAILGVDSKSSLIAAAIRQTLGRAGSSMQAVLTASNKYLMRKRLAESAVSIPSYQLLPWQEAASGLEVDLPVVIKPLALSAGQGVIRVDQHEALDTTAERVRSIVDSAPDDGLPSWLSDQLQSRLGLLVEQYVAGSEFSLEGVLVGGQLHVLALFDKPHPLEGPCFEETVLVTPSNLDNRVQEHLAELVARACQALQLVDGPIHAEVRIGMDGIPRIIEVNPRSIGGLCSAALRFENQMTLEQVIVRCACDTTFDVPRREENAAGVMMIPIPRAGTLYGYSGVAQAEKVAGIESVTISAHQGQRLLALPEWHVYLGFIVARGDTPGSAQVVAALNQAHQCLSFDIR